MGLEAYDLEREILKSLSDFSRWIFNKGWHWNHQTSLTYATFPPSIRWNGTEFLNQSGIRKCFCDIAKSQIWLSWKRDEKLLLHWLMWELVQSWTKGKCQNPAGDKCRRASISFPNHQFSWPSAFQKSLNYIINLIRCFFQIKDEESFSFSSRHKKPRKSPLFLKLKKLQFSAFLSWHFGVNPSSILRRRNGKFDFIEFHA